MVAAFQATLEEVASADLLVHVIDDNASVRRALKRLLGSVGIEAVTYASAQQFLDDLERHELPASVKSLRKALLIMHAPLDDIVEIDNAMKWGFNFEMGPFETWDAIGVAQSVKKMEADGMALLDVDYKGYQAFIDEQAKVMLEAAREANIIK